MSLDSYKYKAVRVLIDWCGGSAGSSSCHNVFLTPLWCAAVNHLSRFTSTTFFHNLVDPTGFEPATSSVRGKRSTVLATSPAMLFVVRLMRDLSSKLAAFNRRYSVRPDSSPVCAYTIGRTVIGLEDGNRTRGNSLHRRRRDNQHPQHPTSKWQPRSESDRGLSLQRRRHKPLYHAAKLVDPPRLTKEILPLMRQTH